MPSGVPSCHVGWPDAVVERMKEKWQEGLSAQQIVHLLKDEFGLTKTRSSIITKLHRLGCSERSVGGRKSMSRTKKLQLAGAALPPPPPIIMDAAIEFSAVIELKDHMCTWPVEGEGGTRFCGARKTRGSFCEHHAQQAYVGKSRRRRSIHAGDEDKLKAYLRAQAQWG